MNRNRNPFKQVPGNTANPTDLPTGGSSDNMFTTGLGTPDNNASSLQFSSNSNAAKLIKEFQMGDIPEYKTLWQLCFPLTNLFPPEFNREYAMFVTKSVAFTVIPQALCALAVQFHNKESHLTETQYVPIFSVAIVLLGILFHKFKSSLEGEGKLSIGIVLLVVFYYVYYHFIFSGAYEKHRFGKFAHKWKATDEHEEGHFMELRLSGFYLYVAYDFVIGGIFIAFFTVTQRCLRSPMVLIGTFVASVVAGYAIIFPTAYQKNVLGLHICNYCAALSVAIITMVQANLFTKRFTEEGDYGDGEAIYFAITSHVRGFLIFCLFIVQSVAKIVSFLVYY